MTEGRENRAALGGLGLSTATEGACAPLLTHAWILVSSTHPHTSAPIIGQSKEDVEAESLIGVLREAPEERLPRLCLPGTQELSF